MKQLQIINFGGPSSTGSADFDLVQKPWTNKNPAGFYQWATDQGMVLSVANVFYASEQYKSDCKGSGDLDVILHVRLQDINTPYSLRTSYGQLLPGAKIISESRRDFLAFELSSQQTIDFGRITSWAWNGDVYDVLGNKMDPPAVTISDRMISTPVDVYGVLEVVIDEQKYEHTLTISPRAPTLAQAESEDNIAAELYAATVMMFCLSRIKVKEIDMPDNLGTCSGGFGGESVTDDTEDEETEPTSYDVRFEVFDYCTGADIPGAEILVDNQRISAGKSITLLSGDYQISATAAGYTPSDEDDLAENDSFTLATLQPTNGKA